MATARDRMLSLSPLLSGFSARVHFNSIINTGYIVGGSKIANISNTLLSGNINHSLKASISKTPVTAHISNTLNTSTSTGTLTANIEGVLNV